MSMARPRSWNVLLAAAGAAALIIEGVVRAGGGLSAGDYCLAVATAAPLAWGTRAPVAVLVGVAAGAILCDAAFDAGWTATALVGVQLFTVALLGDRHRSLIVGALTALAVTAAILAIDDAASLTPLATRLPLVFGTVAVGDTVRSRKALRAATREREEREEREREEEGRRRATEERLRIARELHDTLAHSLVAINVRAGVALDLPESDDASEALEDVKQASATALRDLRATLNLLRDATETAPTTPAFDLDAIPSLVDHARSAGLQADVTVQVNGAAVPSAVGGAAYRIVQEALTNVLRHANASSAQVGVWTTSDSLDIEVTDDGRTDDMDASPGLGIRGMAERATALGGKVDAGPCASGGWRVHAVLPLSGGGRR
jgi:signal transduction histidine kinase